MNLRQTLDSGLGTGSGRSVDIYAGGPGSGRRPNSMGQIAKSAGWKLHDRYGNEAGKPATIFTKTGHELRVSKDGGRWRHIAPSDSGPYTAMVGHGSDSLHSYLHGKYAP